MSHVRIVVIGRSGQVACALMRRGGAAQGVEVVCGGRPDVDLAVIQSLRAFVDRVQPDVVVNAAAYTGVDKAESDSDAAMAINAHGVGALAGLCAERDLPLIHISTDYVFDGSKPSAYVEDDLRKPIGVYGASKAAGEVVIAELAPRHIILRTAWVYGQTGSNFVVTMLRLGQERDELGVVDDQHGTPTLSDDIASAIIEMAQVSIGRTREDPIWGTYHFTGGGETTWYGFAQQIFVHAKRAGLATPLLRRIATSDYPTPAKRPANSVLDCSKFKSRFETRILPWDRVLNENIGLIINSQKKQ